MNMARFRSAHAGLTLVELLITLAIATVLVIPLAAATRSAMSVQTFTGEVNDISQQARFAMQRMTAAVQRTAPYTLSANTDPTSTQDWLSPVTYCWGTDHGASRILETTPADSGCKSATAISLTDDNVTAFSVTTYNAGLGANAVIEIQFTLLSGSKESISLTSRTRLGAGTL
jgi:prepilin-type N-terminal cleavage/methylation domain-containing protein